MLSYPVSTQKTYQDLRLEEVFKKNSQRKRQEHELQRLRKKVIQLEAQKRELLACNSQLKRELEEGQRERIDLLRTNKHLAKRNNELDIFARTVAHDLKIPLSVIMGLTQVLQEDYRAELIETIPDQNEVDECLEGIVRGARRADETIKSLLLLTQCDHEDIETYPIDMVSIVRKVEDHLSSMIKTYEAEISLSEDWPFAIGYGPWVEGVWVNYLSNAIKYGGRSPKIEIGSTAEEDGMVRFWVKDNGQGLNIEEQERIFEPFVRLAKDTIEGTGLGLAIVKCVVEKMGGRVGVESTPGAGATFYFTLPGCDSIEIP